MTYSASIAANRKRFSTRGQNSTSFKSQAATIGPVSNTIMLIILACLLGMLYLTQVTKTNSFGYKVNELRNQQTQLQEEQAELEVTAARLQSLDKIKSSPAAQQLVAAQPKDTIGN